MTLWLGIKGRARQIVGAALLSVLMFQSVGAEAFDPKTQAARDFTKRLQRRAAAELPVVEYGVHKRGNIELAIANNGTFGTQGQSIPDPLTGQAIVSCIFPKNTEYVYLWVAAIWIGARVGRDTLVSTGNEDFYNATEFYADAPPLGNLQYRSIDQQSRFFSSEAISEEDIIAEYADTLTNSLLVGSDPIDGRDHVPLRVKVNQTSMAWSYSYAEDIILFDYEVQNIGFKELEDVYIGIWVDGDAFHTSRNNPTGWNDDIVGFYPTHPAAEGCGFLDTVNIAYHADNDGDPEGGEWNNESIRGAVGVRVVRTPAAEPEYAYNWWIWNPSEPQLDFGPRRRGTGEEPFRAFPEGRLGTPRGDAAKYYMMQQGEFDYDLIYTAVDQSFAGWRAPPTDAATVARGFDTRYLLSFGAFDIKPGDRLPISFAWVAGENVHVDPTDFEELFDANNPDLYYNALEFDDLASNARWASWIYDNPGVDTDGDGYSGKFRVCAFDSTLVRVDTIIDGVDTTIIPVYEVSEADTTYYEGDGVPDFRGAGPPPAPVVKILPRDGELVVRWNGYLSETTPDVFSGVVDFEGYRVYYGRKDQTTALSVISSYDLEDYNRYVLRNNAGGSLDWVLTDIPYTLDSLRVLYGDDFEPLRFTRSSPLRLGDSTFYFEPQDYNVSDLTNPGQIRKVYPDATEPDPNPDFWSPDELTEDGLPKYYEYEFVVRSLLSTIPHHVAVTAFDFGSPVSGLPALESSPLNNIFREYATVPADTVIAKGLDVYVYPNPYVNDGSYRGRGFEINDGSVSEERARLLTFANLPYKCRISIFSLDGDLVREIVHDKAPGDLESSVATWDLVTRNTQAAASGLYYYVVEADDGSTQIGKFMLIM